ncbi:uncharacterized protein LOC123522987 isoform X4 [Mercenaria mercenaria]|uniref:uncharacterized protein LOC123522987 isoform X4 n=1 Tax=Mercenaria mercenaria TaxID=6596 RepID=UPI00234F385C|nr:uncharacterized protein LOC123522987 isoform X4 [Mercenaria mercenaria]
MSRLSRFLPKFLRGDKSAGQKTGDKSQCKIIFLDETEYFIPYKGGFKGQYVLDKTFEQLNLFEKDYFGLRYIDTSGQTHWLDCNKTLSSQLKGCSVPYTFYFGVKFYPADPCKLKEEITRYQFFLQVKRDVLHGRLPVSFEEAAELFAYAVQSEIGDFESQKLPPGYVSEFQFVPNQTDELEDQIAILHRRLAGTVPATAELKFLDKVKWLDMYGVDLHPVLGESNTEYFLGLTPTGIVVYKNKTKVGNYFWPRITKINFKGKVFIIRVKDKINDEHTYAFELATKSACKHLWKCCVEHHTFFRMNQLVASASRTSKPYRSTSQHRNSGRQERQNNADNLGREQPRVLRVQSRRQARRAMSDTRLHQGDTVTGLQYNEGHVTMVVTPEHVKGSRHRSLPDLKGRESPTSTRSAPWETNMDTGMYTSGRESPVSVTQSENVNYLRRHRESDSESGHRRKPYRQGYDSDGGTRNKAYHIEMNSYDQYSVSRRSGYESDTRSSVHGSIRRRKYFPSSRKGSDNESDVSFTRRRRREMDSGSESDISPNFTARQRKTKSVGADQFEKEWQSAMQNVYLPAKENRPNGSIPSIHSAPLGESRQKKMRRRRSKSPGNSKRPPEELRQHIEFDLLEPSEEMTEDQLREIPYVNVETKAEAFKVKYSPSNRRRYRSPKRKSTGDLDQNGKGGYILEEPPPPPYTRTPERTPEPTHRQPTKSGGYYSDTGSLPRRGQNHQLYPQQYNNTVSSHSKHFMADIRSIPQFHENHLFYEPKLSPRYQLHPNPIHRYHPPPTAVFKPIDAVDERNSVMEQRNMNSSQSTSDTKLHDLQGQSDFSSQGHSQQGEGHDLTEDRGGDQGLNNSQSSGGTLINTPPRGHPHRFGTQDAIAKLYSSPARTRRQTYTGNQQGNDLTSQNMPYNRNYGQTNQNKAWNQNIPERSHHANSQIIPGYDNNSNVVKTMPSNNTTNSPSQNGVPYTRDQQRMCGVSDNRNVLPQRHQNGMVNNSVSYSSQFPANRMFYTQPDSAPVNPPENRTSQHSSYTSDNSFAMKSYPYSQGRQGVTGPDTNSYSQNTFYNQSDSQNYSTQSTSESRLGLQPSWQYIGNGRVPGSNRAESAGRGQRVGQRTGSASPSTRSPATTPTKKNRHIEMSPHRGTRPLSTNQNSSSAALPNYHSPDSAISSITSLSLSNVNRSPSKLTSPSGNDSMSEHVSRVRTPAFGRSDIWTEL